MFITYDDIESDMMVAEFNDTSSPKLATYRDHVMRILAHLANKKSKNPELVFAIISTFMENSKTRMITLQFKRVYIKITDNKTSKLITPEIFNTLNRMNLDELACITNIITTDNK